MDARFLNASDDDNVTSSLNVSSLSFEEPAISPYQLYVCDLYMFIMGGVVQLVISVVGLAGKSDNDRSSFQTVRADRNEKTPDNVPELKSKTRMRLNFKSLYQNNCVVIII